MDDKVILTCSDYSRFEYAHHSFHRMKEDTMPILMRITQFRVYILVGLLLGIYLSPAPHFTLAAPTTYYVAPDGSDTSPGTIDAPFKTLNKAVSVVQPGDTVLFRGGTYLLETSGWIGVKGTVAERITFQSYPGEQVIFDGNDLAAESDVIGIGGSYIDFKDMEIRNSPGAGLSIDGGSHIRILNNVIHGSQKQAIWCGSTDFTTVNDILIDGNTVYNNVLENNVEDKSGPRGSAIISHRASNISITNNTVYQNYGEGIDPVLTKGGVIAGNIVHDNYAINIYLDNATDFRVERNFVYTTNNVDFYESSAPATAIMIANETYDLANPSKNITMANNILVGGRFNFGYGDYDVGGGLQNIVFANNTLVNATQSALHIDGNTNHSNLVFANNIVVQSTSSSQMLDSWNGTAGYENLTFSHNLWFGGSPGAAEGTGDIISNPLLVNAGGTTAADYQLRASSPAVNAGITIPAVVSDLWGTCRPQGGAYDMGAQEVSESNAKNVEFSSELQGQSLKGQLLLSSQTYLPLVQSFSTNAPNTQSC